jgi:hypothetical protein
MSTFYFVGGEDHDFTKSGPCTVDTATTAARRIGYARCSLKIASTAASDAWSATLSAQQSSFWLTARAYFNLVSRNFAEVVSLLDSGGNRRVVLKLDSASNNKWQLIKRNAAQTTTVLLTSSASVPSGVLSKIDVFVNFAAAGSLQLYVDGTLVLSYSGDLTTDSVTSLAGFALGHTDNTSYWSEVICADTDTRGLSLATLAPSANGNSFTFDSGSVSSINETTLDDATLISSGTAGQLAQFTVGSSGITGNPAVKAVCVTARAAKGGSGPQNAKMSVRTGGADYLSGSLALPASLGRIQGVFTTNPGTSAPWAPTELTAAGFNVGIQSVT